MKRQIIILFLAAVAGILILFLDLIVGNATRYTIPFDSPWLLGMEVLVFTTVVGYLSPKRGWLMGMLAMISTYSLIFFIVSFFISLIVIDAWRMGESVMHLIRMNASAYGIQTAIRLLFFWVLLPSLAIGAIGGTLGEQLYKHEKG